MNFRIDDLDSVYKVRGIRPGDSQWVEVELSPELVNPIIDQMLQAKTMKEIEEEELNKRLEARLDAFLAARLGEEIK